jgi:hypothetical protein
MPDYSRGKIYTIRNRNDKSKIYVGSTIEPLCRRLAKHKHKSKSHGHYILYIEVNNDWDNWYIELYENYPCDSKEELLKREGEVIREIGTLNNKIAGRDLKQYYIDNIDKIKKYKQEYYIENADKIKEYKQKYYIENSENIKKRVKNNITSRKEQENLV